MKDKVVAIITAGGRGTRTGHAIPKQFISVFDKPVLVYTLEAFQRHSEVNEIVVACLEGWEPVIKAYQAEYGISKLTHIVTGGNTTIESIREGFQTVYDSLESTDIVMAHDGNRPMITQRMISECIDSVKHYGNGCAVIPCTEVVFKKEAAAFKSDGDGQMLLMLDRDTLLRTQTPHGYRAAKIKSMFDRYEKDNLSAVALCDLFFQTTAENEIAFYDGSTRNFKITVSDDLAIMRAMVEAERKERENETL